MAFLLAKTILIPILVILTSLAIEAMSREFTEDVVTNKFQQWMSQHQRFYKDDLEKAKRFKIFKDNLEYVEKFNNMKNQTYTLRTNEFADSTEEEVKATYTGYKMSKVAKKTKPTFTNMSYLLNDYQAEVPERIDWRETEGVVTSVKHQHQCGCCWAFSTVGAIEGVIANGVSLSAQQLVDCVSGNRGCGGGFMDTAFEYVIYNQGITSEENYPYTQQQGMCRDKNVQSVAQITNFVDVKRNSEEDLKAAVARQPVSVILGVCQNFIYYNRGVFQYDCGNLQNHAVLLVGYGTSDDGYKFWLIKNSWGTQWGENGYMRLLRDAGRIEGLSGIAMWPSYPIRQGN